MRLPISFTVTLAVYLTVSVLRFYTKREMTLLGDCDL